MRTSLVGCGPHQPIAMNFQQNRRRYPLHESNPIFWRIEYKADNAALCQFHVQLAGQWIA
jgi:hypothetical protein